MSSVQKSFTSANFRLRSLGLAVTLGSFFIASASASIIATGQANIAGTATVSSSAISFTNNGLANTFSVQQPDTGGFAGLSGGTINNLSGGQTTLAPFVSFTVAGVSPVFFDLQGFNPGLGTNAACASNAVGTQCTPTGSFFTLTQQTANSVAVTLNGFGIAYTGTSATGSDATTFGFTTQVVPGTIGTVLSAVQGGGITNSYSVTFNATAPTGTPEPATMLLFGAGLLGVGMIGKFKKAF